MIQTAGIRTKAGSILIELPDPHQEVIPGVEWGRIEEFPMPAYWFYQVLAQRLAGHPPEYKVGASLSEEVGACLLSGYGIPANIAIGAFEHLRDRGAFAATPPDEQRLLAWLKEPIRVGDRSVHYRFAGRKAHYLARALPMLQEAPAELTGRALRTWLTQLPGVGLKTASMIVRNWQRADDVAILDIHLMRVGQVIGLFPMDMTVERHYVELEERFLALSDALGLRAAELDAAIWHDMASSPMTVRQMIEDLRTQEIRPRRRQRASAAQPVTHA